MKALITGACGCGKTTELLARAAEAATHGNILITAASDFSIAALRMRLPEAAQHVHALHEVALQAFGESPPEIIDELRAFEIFQEAAKPLLSLEWAHFFSGEIDPELPGMRSPHRFLQAVFHLTGKLADAQISPEAFLQSALRGATSFYGKPPNFAHADLLAYTKDVYRDSLDVGAEELRRQYRHETDLAKVVAQLYRSSLDHALRAGCLTQRELVSQAAALLAGSAQAVRRLHDAYPAAFVDDAQDLTPADLAFLQALYGTTLDGVTFAGDAQSAMRTFRGARPDRVFALVQAPLELHVQHRSPPAIDAACRRLLGEPVAAGSPEFRPALTLFRATTQRAEARFIAEHISRLLEAGAAPDDAAVLFRSVAEVEAYVDPLITQNIRVQIVGDVQVLRRRDALDALAVLWSLHDPFRHDYLLRMLCGPAMALSDATLYSLCSEPADAQTLLFEEGETAAKASGRWDARRDVRLGWNVLRGDRDAAVSPLALERLKLFRSKREQWLRAMETLELPELVRLIWNDGLAAAAAAGSARAAYQQYTLQGLYERVCAFTQSHACPTLGDFLEDVERCRESSFLQCERTEIAGAVRFMSIDAAMGREFDHVVLPDARAGSFPQWYTPDAFLFSPSLGMVAKENAGDGRTARTAKFSYYMYKTKTREAYNREQRRAFVYGLRRARRTALVTASERATRGVTTPEFLAELQAARLPGTQDLSDRWRPTETAFALS